jgi:hypothetical protein
MTSFLTICRLDFGYTIFNTPKKKISPRIRKLSYVLVGISNICLYGLGSFSFLYIVISSVAWGFLVFCLFFVGGFGLYSVLEIRKFTKKGKQPQLGWRDVWAQMKYLYYIGHIALAFWNSLVIFTIAFLPQDPVSYFAIQVLQRICEVVFSICFLSIMWDYPSNPSEMLL